MRLKMKEKLQMCEEHVIKGYSLSHVSEMHSGYNIGNLKYIINIYRKFGTAAFIEREEGVYQRDTKLLAIGRVKNGESIRSVALDLGLIEPSILRDWVKLYDEKGIESVRDTYSRKNYLSRQEKARKIANEDLVNENTKLRAEIEYLKKSQSLTQKLEGVTRKAKAKIVTE